MGEFAMANTLEKKLTHDNFVTEKVDVIKSRLLGDYNAKGKYIINKKIVEELIDLKKHIFKILDAKNLNDLYSIFDVYIESWWAIHEEYFEKPGSHKSHELLHTHYTAREKYKLDGE